MAGDDPAPGFLKRGSKVRLKGLSAAYLNGAIGTIMAAQEPEPDGGPGRWPVRLISPEACVAQHPDGVKVKPFNLELVVEGGPLPLDVRQMIVRTSVQKFLAALDEDVYPEQAIEGLFGVEMVTTRSYVLPSITTLPIGALMYNGWTHIRKAYFHLHSTPPEEAAERFPDLGYDPNELKRVGEAFGEEISNALLEGELPSYFARQVRELLQSPALVDTQWMRLSMLGPNNVYLQELAKRNFRGIPWNNHMLSRMAGLV